MRLIDADAEIVKQEEEIKGLNESLAYWKLRRQYDRNDRDVLSKIGKTKKLIADAEEKIKYLMTIPDAVPESKMTVWMPSPEPYREDSDEKEQN